MPTNDFLHTGASPFAGGATSALTDQPNRLARDGEQGHGSLASAIMQNKGVILERWLTTQFDAALIARYAITGTDRDVSSLRRRFLEPLLSLLCAYLRTGEPRYADVYLDERLRYAPHQASPEVRLAYFREVLSAEEASVSGAVAPELREHCRKALQKLHAPLTEALPNKAVRILALGDCLMNEVRVSLVGACRRAGTPVDFRMQYFSAGTGGQLPIDQAVKMLAAAPVDLIALSFLSYKGIAPYSLLLKEADGLDEQEIEARVVGVVAMIRDFIGRLRQHTDAPFLLHNASGLPLSVMRRKLALMAPLSAGTTRVLRAINAALVDLAASTPRVILIDEDAVATERGLRACEERLIPTAVVGEADFHTSRFGEFLTERYTEVIDSYRALSRVKVIAVDFDNTLWKGVMADGPVTHDRDLQATLKTLKNGGVLLVATSKNDPKNIRWDEMTLEPEDFVIHEIGWQLKSQSLQSAAQSLNLDLNSFVLLDDNPAELEMVRSQLPTVGLLDPTRPHTLGWLKRMLTFPSVRETEEARARTEIYRQQVQRKEAMYAKADYPALMRSLGLQVRFRRARKDDLARVGELVQRTNQFNTTTLRYGHAELGQLLSSQDHGVYVAELADKFGKIGLVSAVVVSRQGSGRVIDSFVMSCRAMGFALEQLVLRKVMDAEGGDAVRFVGRFVPTDRNAPASGLFSASGFVQAGDHEWVAESGSRLPDAPEWFQAL